MGYLSTLFVSLLLANGQAQAASFTLGGPTSPAIISGSECEPVLYRVPIDQTYEGKLLDMLVDITEEDNQWNLTRASHGYSIPCTRVVDGTLSFVLDSVRYSNTINSWTLDESDDIGADGISGTADDGDDSAHMNMTLTVVERNTTTPVTVDRLIITGFDLDQGSGTDDIYYISASNTQPILASDSEVDLSENTSYNTYNLKNKGRLESCNDTATAPDSTCRASSIFLDTSSVTLRIQNDLAYVRLFNFSFRVQDLEAIIGTSSDYGDTPNTYPVGAQTIGTALAALGTGFVPDGETAQQFTNNADGDDTDGAGGALTALDDEDGVFLSDGTTKLDGADLTTGETTTLSIKTFGSGYLNVWIDWNQNNSFADSGEKIIIDQNIVNTGETAIDGTATTNATDARSTTNISVPVPAGAVVGQTYARFKFTSEAAPGVGVTASKGEVEDYSLILSAPPSFGTGMTYCESTGNLLLGPNLISGGSFSKQGSLSTNIPGATTGYEYYTGVGFSDGWPNDKQYEPENGKYLITSRTGPNLYGAALSSARESGLWHDLRGVQAATNSTDKFMVINGDETPGGVFVLPISVEVGDNYEFSAYFSNLISRPDLKTYIEPNIAFEYSIDDGDTWIEIDTTGNVEASQYPDPAGWQQSAGFITSSITGTMLVRLNSIAPGGSGNDFAVDELVFQKCSAIPVGEASSIDYSDAPADNSTAPNGITKSTAYGTATHVVTSGIQLGASITGETSAVEDADNDSDDGVFTDAALTAGLQGGNFKPEDSSTLYIPVSGSGKLYAWIDWDGNGVFGNNSNELIANGIAGANETLIVNASVPIAANLGTTYARFRFSSDAALTEPTGAASDGEVEDYQVTIANTATAPTAPAIAYCSNTWTLDGGVYKATTSQGVAISASTTAEPGTSWSFAPNDALNTSGNFSFAALNGSPSLSTVFTWDTSPEDGRLANAANDAASGTLTFSFGVPVKNPVLHIDRQGGYGSSAAATPQGLSNSSIITPNTANASASFTRLAGTTHFLVTSNSIQRTPNETMQDTGVTGASGADSTIYTAMGSVQVNGTFNSLSLDLSGVGVEGAGADGIEFVICAEPYDYGDAPASYGEAAHKIPDTPVVYLGDVAPDHEPQILNTANGGSDGTGDDLNGSNDEDAYVKLPAVWTSQSHYRLKLTCNDTGAFVSGWVDFNQNNQFDVGERNTDYPSKCSSTGSVTLNWTGLSGLTAGNTYARLRIGSDTDEISTATGTASDGEVEDYPIVLQATGTPPGACNGELSWLNLAGQPAYPTASWNVNWAERGLNATLGFSTTMTGSNAKWTSAAPRVFTESNFINRFSSPGYALGLNHPADLSGTGSTIANIGFDTPLPANTYMVVRDVDATNESISFSNNSLGSLPAPSLWETQSTTELNANAIETPSWNNPSLFAAWDAANQKLVTLSDGPNNDQEAYVWPVAGLTDIRVTYQTYAGSANIGFVSCIPQDYGDAPNTYLTTKSAAGPQHGIINDVRLGANTPDTDSDGQPSTDGNGDGADEDGISSLPTLTSSDRSFSATVSARNDTANPATLVGWIDFDNNGTLDADEAAIRTIAAGSSNASYTLNWSNIPVDIQTGDSYLRLRLTTDSLSNREPGGAKRDGEVEDYLITIKAAGVMVSGRVFNDSNVDAANDSTEIGVTNLPVVLYETISKTCISTRTNGSGNYVFKDVTPGTYQVYEASRESVPTPGQCGPVNAKDPSGYRSTTSKVREAFTVTTNDITGQDFGNVKLPVFEPDNTGQILPGNVLFYAHKFTTPTAGSVRFSSLSSTHRSSGWSSIIYRDENCDGKLNQSDGASPLQTSSMEVNANDKVCLINKVYAPSNVAANEQYAQNITADFDFKNIVAGTLALTVRDVTTAKQVQAPALPATPEVVAEPITPAQEPVDATPTTPYIPEVPEAPAQAQVDPTPVTPAVGPSRLELRKTVKNISQGTAETSTVNSADPGNILEYRIYYSNTGTGPLSDLTVNDRVPAYTELVGVADCGMILPDMGCTASPLSLDDALQWTFTGQLPGGSGSSVSYQVVIDQ